MSAEYVSLSFFKSHELHYRYEPPFIYFTCPHCCLEAKMNAKSTVWSCKECNKGGTLMSLIEMVEKNGKEKIILQQIKVYQPKEEYRQIRDSFEYLLERYGNSTIQKLYEKVKQLIDYYQRELERRRP